LTAYGITNKKTRASPLKFLSGFLSGAADLASAPLAIPPKMIHYYFELQL